MQHLAGDRVEVATAAWAEQRVLAGGRTQLVVLHDGERIEGVPGQRTFRRIRFAEHGIPVVVPEAGAGRTVPESISSYLCNITTNSMEEIVIFFIETISLTPRAA